MYSHNGTREEDENQAQIIEFVCLFLEQQSPVGQDLLIQEVSRSHTATHHIR
jgi:hypothetical protein